MSEYFNHPLSKPEFQFLPIEITTKNMFLFLTGGVAFLNFWFGSHPWTKSNPIKEGEKERSLRPPKHWWDKMFGKISRQNSHYTKRQVSGTVASIWWNLSTAKRKEIREREGKEYGRKRA